MSQTTEPFLVGYGPVTFSTCLELVRPFQMVLDVNSYYRDLGVSPYATRRELREAYQAKQGWKSRRLTYILTKLLDPEIREVYDAMPLGSVFVDEYWDEALRRKRARDVTKLRAQGFMREAEVLDEQPLIDREKNLSEVPDTFVEDGYGDAYFMDEEWPWAFYLWGSHCQDVERLREWQGLLITALSERREYCQLAIGFAANTDGFEVLTVGYRTVVFLDDGEQPTEALAQQAASRVIQHTNKKEKKWRKPTFVVEQKPLPRPQKVVDLPGLNT